MINYVRGDVTEAPQMVIVHGCNAQGKMESGVAKAIKAKWPKAYEYYKQYHEWCVNDPRMGKQLPTGIIIPVRTDGKVIVNAITQQYYGRDPNVRYVSYDAVRSSMIQLRMLLRTLEQTEIAIPKIGAGLGNGDWSIISKIIEEELDGTAVTVYEFD